MNVKKIIAPLIIIFTLTSCSQRDDGTLLGNIIGAGLGALVGFQFGSGVGGALSIAGGTIAGGLIGGEIANQLNEDEQKEYGNATQKLLNDKSTLKTINWTSKENTNKSGKITKLSSFTKNSKNCQDVEQAILVDGKENFKVTTFCSVNGDWKPL